MKSALERLSSLATISRHQIAFGITPDILAVKSQDARVNPRRREILVLHRGNSDRIQRMLNALEPGTYIRPHRHANPPTAEALVLLTGSIGFVPFLDDGTPDADNLVLLDKTRGAVAVDCREGIWHTFVALEPDTVVFEAKPGPFDPLADKEFAPWAPADDSPDVAAYLTKLERLFRKNTV